MNHRLFKIGIEVGLRYLDPDVGLCLFERNGQPYFQGRAHDDAQSSVILAVGLLHRDAMGDREQVLRILRALIATPPSWNVGFRLALLGWLAQSEGRRRIHAGDVELAALLRQAIEQAAVVVAARTPGHVHRPGYTNFWLLDLAGLILAGQFLAAPVLVEDGRRMLGEFAVLQEKHQAPEEFNSPAYLPIQMAALALLAACADDPAVAAQAEEWAAWLRRHGLRHWDDRSGVLMAPWSRAYPADRHGEQPLLRLLLAVQDDAAAWTWLRSQLEIDRREWQDAAGSPSRSAGSLLTWGILFGLLPIPPWKAAQAGGCTETLPSGPVGTPEHVTLKREDAGSLSLACVSHWHLWDQPVPLALHRRGQAAPLLYHHTPLPQHLGARFTAVQQGTAALVAVSYIAMSARTNVDAGLRTIPSDAPVILQQVLQCPRQPASLRLFLGNEKLTMTPGELPVAEPLILAGEDWAAGLLIGPVQADDPLSLYLDENEDGAAIIIAHRRRQPVHLQPGDTPAPYAWYYLAAAATDAAQMCARMQAVHADDRPLAGSLSRVTVTDGSVSLSLEFDARIFEAKEWTSNGWTA